VVKVRRSSAELAQLSHVQFKHRLALAPIFPFDLLWPPCVADADIIFLPGFHLSFFLA